MPIVRTYAENLLFARDNFALKLAEISENPKPTYNIDGQMVDWTDYYRFLMEQIDKLNVQIDAGSPFEIISETF